MSLRNVALAIILLIAAILVGINILREEPLEKFETHHANGTLKSVQFLNGAKQTHGDELHYSDDGKLISKISWNRGHRIHQWEYWPNGKVRSEAYEDSNYQVIIKEYPENAP